MMPEGVCLNECLGRRGPPLVNNKENAVAGVNNNGKLSVEECAKMELLNGNTCLREISGD